jgi:hypothetical protein
MGPHATEGGPPKLLLVVGITLVVAGAGFMDQAGRTQSALWWDVSGVCAFLGFVLALIYLIRLEGPGAFGLRRGAGQRQKGRDR